jgi:hypothetical protein
MFVAAQPLRFNRELACNQRKVACIAGYAVGQLGQSCIPCSKGRRAEESETTSWQREGVLALMGPCMPSAGCNKDI